MPDNNLLVTEIKASPSNGLANKRIFNASVKLSVCKINPKNRAPKKVLPTSPMNTLDGCQLSKINPIKQETYGQKFNSKYIEIVEKIIIMHPVNRPSRPSAKLMKFIHPTDIKIKPIRIITSNGPSKEFSKISLSGEIFIKQIMVTI